MADKEVTIGGESPVQVAYKLYLDVADAEDFTIHAHGSGSKKKPGRKWILDTYAECLKAVIAPSARLDRSDRR